MYSAKFTGKVVRDVYLKEKLPQWRVRALEKLRPIYGDQAEAALDVACGKVVEHDDFRTPITVSRDVATGGGRLAVAQYLKCFQEAAQLSQLTQ